MEIVAWLNLVLLLVVLARLSAVWRRLGRIEGRLAESGRAERPTHTGGPAETDADAVAADRGLVKEMLDWFFAESDSDPAGRSATEVLNERYQDNGFTVDVLRRLEKASRSGRARGDFDRALRKSQDWFEGVDPVMNGYRTVEEAIEGIYLDDGQTLDLYQRIKDRNESR